MVRPRMKRNAPAILALLGALLISLGVGAVFVPAGVIVAGGFLLAAGLLVDFGGER